MHAGLGPVQQLCCQLRQVYAVTVDSTCSPSFAKSADKMLGDTMMLCLSNLSTRLPLPLARTANDLRDAEKQALCCCLKGDPASWLTRLLVCGCTLVNAVIAMTGKGTFSSLKLNLVEDSSAITLPVALEQLVSAQQPLLRNLIQSPPSQALKGRS